MATATVSRPRQALHLQVDVHGVLSACNPAAEPWLEPLGCAVGRRAPPALRTLVDQALTEGVVTGRVPCGHESLSLIVVSTGQTCDVYGSNKRLDPDPLRVTWDNPNPVLRVDREGQVLYANPAAAPLLQSWGVLTGDRLPDGWINVLRQVSPGDRRELVAGGGYAITVCPREGSNQVHLYGRKLG